MKTFQGLMLVFMSLMVACGGASGGDDKPPPNIVLPCEDAGVTTLADAAVDAADAGLDVQADAAPCALRIDSFEVSASVRGLAPKTVLVGQVANALIIAHGCGFTPVQDVEVNVGSVPFTIVDDETLVFGLTVIDSSVPLPYNAEIDIIIKPATQVQTFITYVAQ